MRSRHRKTAFTLIEILVVLGIISVLAAILFPAFWTVRGRARQTSCLSNLRQIGASISLYMQDYDGKFPYAVDPSDRAWPSTWDSLPAFQAQIPTLPLLHDVVLPYTSSKAIFVCPADTGFKIVDFTGLDLDATPSSAEKFGTSYYYRTEFAASGASDSSVTNPAQINLLFDGAGHWHGTRIPLAQRYNTLFADNHAKNISRDQMEAAWDVPISGG